MRAATILVLFSTVAGCAASHMSEVPAAGAMAAPPDRALVVFVRPSSLGGAVVLSIIDEQGHFVGDSEAGSHFAVTALPGRHRFVLWSGNTDLVEADLAPGRVYYVFVDMTIANDHLLALSPRDPRWPELPAWLARTRRLVPDFPDGERYLAARRDDVAERVRRGLEHAQGWSPEERAAHTLSPGDGS